MHTKLRFHKRKKKRREVEYLFYSNIVGRVQSVEGSESEGRRKELFSRKNYSLLNALVTSTTLDGEKVV